MSEWWTYTLQDFLMFSPRTYFRMFGIYNREIWPAQIVAVLLGLVILVLLRRPTPAAERVVSFALAACWLFTGIAFHIHRYAGIFWVAAYFGAAFALEGALWIVRGLLAGRGSGNSGSPLAGRAASALVLFALAVEPLVGPALGRSWSEVAVFGVTPDPTAIATLGVLLRFRGRARWPGMVIPLLWCAVSWATLRTMRSPEAWIPAGAATFAALVAMTAGRKRLEAPAAQ